MPRLSLVLLLLGLGFPVAHAAGTAGGCVAIDDDRARLACYDEAYGRTATSRAGAPAVAAGAPVAAAATTAAAATVTPAGPPAPSPEQSRQNFGLSAEKVLGPQGGPTEIEAKVTAVQANEVTGRAVVTLDNGQVWQQLEASKATKRPRPGDKVVIREASLGSYLMVAPERGSARVRRVR
ncbi:MAG: hypothetical protein EHM83_05915 [Burkholderiales bacterium]|nr:MAG: hypothetical protein EHM83_05915 [Burkholderiales bacterium]